MRFDWDAIRLEFIRGGEDCTIRALSAKTGYPTESAMQKRSAAENWYALRKQFSAEVVKLTQQLETKLQAQTSLAAVTEVRERQSQGFIRLQKMALELAEEIYSETELDPVTGETLRGKRWREAGLGTVRMLYSGAAQGERSVRGMEEYSVNLNDLTSPEDLKKLTTDQKFEVLQRMRKARGMAHSESPFSADGSSSGE